MPVEVEVRRVDRARVRRLRWIAALLAALVAAAVGLAAVQWSRASDLDDASEARREAADAARTFAEALFTYAFDDLEGARERIVGLTTHGFMPTYDAYMSGLRATIEQQQVSSVGTARDVYLVDAQGGRVRAIVVVDSERRSAVDTRQLTGTYVEVELVREDGRWRVAEVAMVGAADETVTSSTTTAVP
jgi:hypothetical protein